MIYNVSNLMAERDRLIWELEQLQRQHETIQKRNQVAEYLNRLNQLDDMIQRSTANRNTYDRGYTYTGQQPQSYGMVYPSNSPYVTQNPAPPTISPYQSRNAGYGAPVVYNTNTNDVVARRYMNKPELNTPNVQQQQGRRLENEPPGAYVVKAEPPKPVKKYTKDSKYPLVCDLDVKSFEVLLNNGLIQRDIEPAPGIVSPEINLEKSKANVKSYEDFFDTFKDKIIPPESFIETSQAHCFNRTETYVFPANSIDKILETFKNLQADKNLEDIILDSISHNDFPKLLNVMLDKRYTALFNNVVKYNYDLELECDSIEEDKDDLKKAIDNIKLSRVKQHYKEVFKALAQDFKHIKLEKVYDDKFIKIHLSTPTLLVNCNSASQALKKNNAVSTLTMYSYAKLYDVVLDAFKYYGENLKRIELITVDEHMDMAKYTVYSFSTESGIQYTVVPVK